MLQMLLEVNGNVFLHQVKRKNPQCPGLEVTFSSYSSLPLCLSPSPFCRPKGPCGRLAVRTGLTFGSGWVTQTSRRNRGSGRWQTHTYTNACVHTHIHANAHKYKETRTHTHTDNLSQQFAQSLSLILSLSFLSFTSLLPPTWQQTSCWVKVLSL